MRIQYLYSVAAAAVDPFDPDSMDMFSFISGLPGFAGAHLADEYGTLCFFRTYNQAAAAKYAMDGKGIYTGTNICRFRWDGGDIAWYDPDGAGGEAVSSGNDA